jgi:hypothetical protein
MSDLEIYSRIALSALAQANPISAAIDVGLKALEEERVRIWIEEMASRGINLSPEQLKNKEILHAFRITLKAILNVHRHEKIKRFAALFSCFVNVSEDKPIDRYEEALKILDELSEIEFQILLILNRFECENLPQPDQNALKRIGTYWANFQKQCHSALNISQDELRGRLGRLTRTGLVQSLDGSYLTTSGDKFYLTEIYKHFMATIDSPISTTWIAVSESH